MKSILPNSRKHDISFHASGKIDISAHIARKLALAPGDVIDIVCDARGEWCIYVKHRAASTTGRHYGRVWATAHGGKGTFRAWSKTLTGVILSAAGVGPVLRCPCGDEIECDNIKYITIIYRRSL